MMSMGSAPTGDALQPHLAWGLKRSFVGYISALEDGKIEAADGVFQLGSSLAFPVSVATDVPAGEYWFDGRVSFSGHGGMMRLDLVRPRVTLRDGAGQLAVKRADANEWFAIADLSETRRGSAFGLTRVTLSATLTDEGSALFNGQYPAGQAMEDVELVLR